jgi:DNA polymerase-1
MAKRNQTLLPGMDDTESPVAASSPAEAIEQQAETTTAPSCAVAAEPAAPAPDGELSLPDLTGRTVYCIDANSLIFQVFHAIPEMTNPKGQPVNAVFGFTRDILFLLEEKKPDYLFCAFDMKGPTFRHALYDQYKAQRSEMPADLSPQFPAICRMLEALEVPVLGLEGYEADDILATVARLAAGQGGECYLVTGDKDCRQLISDRVKVFNVRKNQVYGADELQQEWGIRPDQVVDFQSLVGDAVDNVPGIAGIGPKTAQQLLAQFGSLEEVLSSVDQITGAKRKQSLIEGRDLALLSRDLVRLDVNVPIEIDWSAGRVDGFDKQRVLELFQEFGFHSFAAKVRAMEIATKAAVPVPPPQWKADYRIVDTPELLDRLIAEMSQARRLSLDTETTHIWPTWAEIVGLSFSWQEEIAYYVPVCGPPGETCLDRRLTLEKLRPLLEDARIEKVGQNLKYDLIVLRRAGIEVQGVGFDTMVASYLLDAGERNHNLDELAHRYLDHSNIAITTLIGTGKDQKRMDEVPIRQVADYAAEDADVALRLTPILERKLQSNQLDRLFHDLELPLVDVLVEMESNGIRVDVERLRQLSDEFGQRVTALEKEVYQQAGREFNIGSPKQLQEVLFQEQNLPILKKAKTGPSTDVDVLEELARIHPLPAKIIEYRQFAKLKNTYVDALPGMVNPRTGRVHAAFNQVVAATGRLSSHDPNLQNIPIRSDSGRAIRSAFLPADEGWQLLAADYSQIELRILAHFCQDPTLCEAFAQDEDIHTRVASEVNQVPPDQVSSEMRRQAKAINFGIIYGQSPFGLAKQLGIDTKEAERFIDAYFAQYPGVEVFLAQVLDQCRANGYVSTILGRRRAIQGIRPEVRRQRNPPERTAINTVIQGSAADLIKQAMITVHRRLKHERLTARMLLQIHDELVFEAPREEIEVLSHLVAEEMSQVMSLSVPLKVDIKSGDNWAEV